MRLSNLSDSKKLGIEMTKNDKNVTEHYDKDLGRECLMVFMLLYAWLTSTESEMGLVRSVPASAASSANPRKAVLHKAGRLLL